jgi:hypothetical protein
VIGNFDEATPNRVFMDHVLEWRLRYRSAAELAALYRRSAFGETPVTIRRDDDAVQLLAVATRA